MGEDWKEFSEQYDVLNDLLTNIFNDTMSTMPAIENALSELFVTIYNTEIVEAIEEYLTSVWPDVENALDMELISNVSMALQQALMNQQGKWFHQVQSAAIIL